MILIGLGANLPSHAGSPERTLRVALRALEMRGVGAGLVSHFYRTPAWPDPSDPPFVNAAASLKTSLAPGDLLQLLHDIEKSFGRHREDPGTARNAPRTLDLDLLDYDRLIQEGPPHLPHPGIEHRAFVLIPLRDVAPGWVHPVSGLSLDTLIERLGAEADIPVRIG